MRSPISDYRRPTFYVGCGDRLLAYAIDTEAVVLSPLNHSAALPANVQYACPHVSRQYLYAVSSNGGPGVAGDRHYLSALRIDARSALHPNGDPVALRHRPIHVTTDVTGEHALVAYNNPSTITVHRITEDGRVGCEVEQPSTLDTGIYAHQIYVAPSNATAIVVTRGNDATRDRPEDPGALKIFSYSNGVLSNRLSIAPSDGYGFGPRNIEVAPARDWIYVSLERQNALSVFRFDGLTIDTSPSFQCDTLTSPARDQAAQIAGAVHAHPSGRFVYVANRSAAGGENSVAVYSIDARTGRPHLIQSVDTRGVSPRTFSIDASGRMLVTANSRSRNLSAFSIASDGRLTLAQQYDVNSSDEQVFWSGIA